MENVALQTDTTFWYQMIDTPINTPNVPHEYHQNLIFQISMKPSLEDVTGSIVEKIQCFVAPVVSHLRMEDVALQTELFLLKIATDIQKIAHSVQ